LDSSTVEQALYRANELQPAFDFQSAFYTHRLPLDEKYKLPNGGYDLCGAVEYMLRRSRRYKKLPRPLLVLTSALFGDADFPNDPEAFYFSSQEDSYDAQVTIISTQPAEELKSITLQGYLFMMLSTHILSTYANISYHDEARGCLLDYDGEWKDEDNCFLTGSLCADCEVEIQKRVRQNKVSLEQIAAAVRLFNRAIGRKYCFIVMPFKKDLDDVYQVVRSVLEEKGWQVKRADEVFLHRRITDGYMQEILSSDLVIADLTGLNPNVFYEVGLTHALGNDLLLLSQPQPMPFDLFNEQTVFYQSDQLEELRKSLQHRVGSGKT
jgi:hypothetical protein